MKSNVLTSDDAIYFARYKIYCEYFGKFDDCSVIAFAYTLADAKLIVDTLNEKYSERPMEFSYVLCAEYDEVLDEIVQWEDLI